MGWNLDWNGFFGKKPVLRDVLKEKILDLVERYKGSRRNTKVGKMEVWQFARWQLAECWAGDDIADRNCHSVSIFLFGKESSKDWTGAEARAIQKWMDPQEKAGDMVPSDMAKSEARAIVTHSMKDAGQEEL